MRILSQYNPSLVLRHDLSEKKAILLWSIYHTLKPKLLKIQTFEYEHLIMMLILIHFNLFSKVFLTTVHVPQIDSLYWVIVIATSYFSHLRSEPLYIKPVSFVFIILLKFLYYFTWNKLPSPEVTKTIDVLLPQEMYQLTCVLLFF